VGNIVATGKAVNLIGIRIYILTACFSGKINGLEISIESLSRCDQ
jgi:hypothetical protein